MPPDSGFLSMTSGQLCYPQAGMRAANGPHIRRGIVVSDLHLFTRRSRAVECLQSLRAELASVDVLVLNGDTFDFRWSTLRDRQATIAAALDWLRALASDLPTCRIHYVLGNHDCLAPFRDQLAALTLPRLRWHEHFFRLENALFLHGDCAHEPMDPEGLRRYREPWENDRQRGALAAGIYAAIDRLGLTRFAHERHFPHRRTVERIAHYLDRASLNWRDGVRDCYFGHTHRPFSDYRHSGVAFHNSGSAIRGMAFNPLRFETRGEENH